MNKLNNRNNERAKFAYVELKKLTCKKSEFRSLARNFPTLVQANGLTVATAYLYSNPDKAHHKALDDIIVKWLKECEYNIKNDRELMQFVANSENERLQCLTVEVMALLVWIKRIAEGMFNDNESIK